MSGSDQSVVLNVGRQAPQPVADGVLAANTRGGVYGEIAVVSYVPTKHGFVDEGSYCTARTPTPGTNLQLWTGGTTFSDTVAMWVIQAGAQRVYLSHIRLQSFSNNSGIFNYAIKTDIASRVPTANSQSTVFAAAGENGVSTAAAILYYPVTNGAAGMTVPAASPWARLVARGCLGQPGGQVSSDLLVTFGDSLPRGSLSNAGTDGALLHSGAPPVVIGAGHFAVLNVWNPFIGGQVIPIEFEVGLWTR